MQREREPRGADAGTRAHQGGRPRESRTLEIIGIPETGLPIGEAVQLTAQIRRNDGGTETASNPHWTSSNPEFATIDDGEPPRGL